MTCSGNSSEFCGAGNRLDVYKLGYTGSTNTVPSVVIRSTSSTSSKVSSTTSTKLSTSSTKASTSSSTSKASSTTKSSTSSKLSSSSTKGSSSSTSSVSKTSTSTSAVASPTGPVVVQSVGNYVTDGCWTEGNGVRALSPGAFANDTMTVESCAASCAGYTYFGVEYGRECEFSESF